MFLGNNSKKKNHLLPWAAHMAQNWKCRKLGLLRHPLYIIYTLWYGDSGDCPQLLLADKLSLSKWGGVHYDLSPPTWLENVPSGLESSVTIFYPFMRVLLIFLSFRNVPKYYKRFYFTGKKVILLRIFKWVNQCLLQFMYEMISMKVVCMYFLLKKILREGWCFDLLRWPINCLRFEFFPASLAWQNSKRGHLKGIKTSSLL